MKNRLSTLLMVLLTAFMVQCSGCKDDTKTDPSIEATWNIVSITATNGLQDRYSQALGTSAAPANGTMVIGASCILNKPAGGGPTAGGSGTGTIAKTDAQTGTLTIAFTGTPTPIVFSYSALTATTVTLSGNTTPLPGKTTVNTTVITLKR